MKPERILFLDIDGVLNDHAMCEVPNCCTIKPACMASLNRIIHDTDCKIVLSSAWRYIVHGHDMTCRGFEYMLRTHGLIDRPGVILDLTRPDAALNEPRSAQILHWLREAESCCGLALEIRTFHWAVVDDLDLGFSACEQCGPRFVRTNGKSGLNHVSAQQIIDVFNGQIKV